MISKFIFSDLSTLVMVAVAESLKSFFSPFFSVRQGYVETHREEGRRVT